MKTNFYISGKYWVMIFLITLSGFCTVSGQDQSAITVQGRWSEGECYAISAKGKIAFYANGATLEIADFSTPATPVKLSAVTLEGRVEGLAIAHDLLYVVGGKGYLHILDVADPAHPQILSFMELAGSIDIEVSGQYAYISAESAGLIIVDISDPQNPVVLSDGEIQAIIQSTCISGDFAYASTNVGFAVIDIADKTEPVLDTSITLAQYVRGMDCHDSLLFVGAIDMGLLIYSIKDPANPRLLSTYYPGGDAEDVVYRDGYLYVANRYAGMYILDISDPEAPVPIGGIDTQRAASIVVNDDFAYIADTWAMAAIDISIIDTPIIAGVLDVGDIIRNITVDKDHLYVANNYDGINILDVSDVQQPEIASRFTLSITAYDIIITDTIGLIANGDFGLMIISVANPDMPYLISQVNIGQYISKIALKGNYVFGAISQGCAVLDIHDLNMPVMTGIIDLGDEPDKLIVHDQLLFFCFGRDGIWIYDITNPLLPAELSRIETDSRAQDVAVKGTTAYIAEGWDGLGLVDISDPSAPVRLPSVGLAGFANALKIRGDYGYLSSIYQGLSILDISAINSIRPVATYSSKAEFLNIALSGENIFLVDEDDGVFILSFDSLAVSIPLVGPEGNPENMIITMVRPNPCTDLAYVEYTVTEPTHVTLAVYNAAGELVESLVNTYHQPGVYSAEWYVQGEGSIPGLYYVHAQSGKHAQTIGVVCTSH